MRWFFEHLEYNLTVSLLWSTLVRNMVVRGPSCSPCATLLSNKRGFNKTAAMQYVFYVTHWSACMFYFIASLYNLGQDTWIGRHFDVVVSLPLADR